MTKKRVYSYTKTKHIGIFRHNKSGHYQARKKINGKDYKKSFPSIRDAIQWRRTFNGISSLTKRSTSKTDCSTLEYVWKRFQELHFPTLAPQTQAKVGQQYRQLEMLQHLKMNEINSTLLSEWLIERVEYFKRVQQVAKGKGVQARHSMKNELKILNQLFNWYLEEDEFSLESQGLKSPVQNKHYKLGTIKTLQKKNKKILPEDVLKFFECIENEMFKDLAYTQYFFAGRIGEVLGLQFSSIDFERNTVLIKHTAIYNSSKSFWYLKDSTKTGEDRTVIMTKSLRDCLFRRLANKSPTSDFVFHKDGEPLNYGTVLKKYNNALKKAGLSFTGTHILRHGFATLARTLGGSLDAVLAVTGHKDSRVASQYADLSQDLQLETSQKAEVYLSELSQKLNTKPHLALVN